MQYLGSSCENDHYLLIHDVTTNKLLSECRIQELEVPKEDLEISFHSTGIFVECLMTSEENLRLNFWIFIGYDGQRQGSYIFESRSGRLLSENKTNCCFNFGKTKHSSF